jgi:hypothetical protein
MMRQNEDHRTDVGTAGGIGAMLLAMLGGVARHADDVGRGMLRHADDFGRAGFHQVDDLGRTSLGFGQVDDVGGRLWHASDDLLRFTDDAGHRWPEIDAAENIGRFGVERQIDSSLRSSKPVVNGLDHDITSEALKQSARLLENLVEEEEEWRVAADHVSAAAQGATPPGGLADTGQSGFDSRQRLWPTNCRFGLHLPHEMSEPFLRWKVLEKHNSKYKATAGLDYMRFV